MGSGAHLDKRAPVQRRHLSLSPIAAPATRDRSQRQGKLDRANEISPDHVSPRAAWR